MNLRAYQAAVESELNPLVIPLAGNQKLNISYRKADVTVKEISRFQKMIAAQKSADDGTATINAMDLVINRFLKTVAEWDAMMDGDPVPLTREGLEEADVDLTLINHILNAIGEDGKPDPTRESK